MPGPASRSKRPRRRSAPLLQRSDFTAYLREKADLIAPGDVETAVSGAKQARRRAAKDNHPRMHRQLDLALQLLADHAAQKCPQIPYHTVSLLAVAVLYFLDPMGAIPDWLPGVGTSDDALVFELAFELGAPGVQRYCDWKDLPTDGLLPKPRKR